MLIYLKNSRTKYFKTKRNGFLKTYKGNILTNLRVAIEDG